MPVSKRDTTFTEKDIRQLAIDEEIDTNLTEGEVEQFIADTFDDSVTYQNGTLKVVDHKQFG